MTVDASNALLRWYDSRKRALPWRAEPDEKPDPYRVWLSEIMLQQTTVAAVRPYFESFVRRWPTVADLAAADEAEIMAAWAGLGYYARARNLVACAREVAERGAFPDDEDGLRALPGIGRYTAAAIAAIAFGRRAVPVDANVERVVARYFAISTPLPAGRAEIHEAAERLFPADRCGDMAQALMDLGSAICTARSPQCAACPLADGCAAVGQGEPQAFPVKAPKPARPRRRGFAYWVEHDGDVLLVRRPNSGMLGGMLALPTGAWSESAEPGEGAPVPADWTDAGSVRHIFTHFALDIRLLCAQVPARGTGNIWWPAHRLEEAGLPTLFSKLARCGLAWREGAYERA